MEKELKYITIDYSCSDEKYIDEFLTFIATKSEEIVDFFEIKSFGEKIKVKLWNSIDKFREYYKEIGYNLNANGEVPKWVGGFAHEQSIEVLNLDECRKSKTHENVTVEELKYLILHEFVHSCHKKINKNNSYAWLGEGLATTISDQYKNSKLYFNVSLEEVINGCNNYTNYYTMFYYVYSTYGREYILSLVKDSKLLEDDTPRLYAETLEYMKKFN